MTSLFIVKPIHLALIKHAYYNKNKYERITLFDALYHFETITRAGDTCTLLYTYLILILVYSFSYIHIFILNFSVKCTLRQKRWNGSYYILR